MPSTSAKQHRFMEAIAHNSAFAKKAGVPQSVGKDFSAADKGKKFAGGGAARQKINQQDTQHGAMDMPFKSLKKFTGMKAGGKVRRFEGGGTTGTGLKDVDPNIKYTPEQEAFLTEGEGKPNRSDPYIIARMLAARPAPAPVEERGITPIKTSAASVAAAPTSVKADPSGEDFSPIKYKVNDETGKVYDPEEIIKAAPKTSSKTTSKATPAKTATAPAADNTPQKQPKKLSDTKFWTPEKQARSDVLSKMAAQARFKGYSSVKGPLRQGVGMPVGTDLMYQPRKKITNEQLQDEYRNRVNKNLEDEYNNRGMKKGGKVDTKKPNPFMEMIAKKKEKAEGESPSFQKKEGKKGEKAEMKFAKGGMARGGMMGGNMNAKGSMSGSSRAGENTKIQKKGLTEGKVIKMASGGSVSSRADGIASRGKTNCKIC